MILNVLNRELKEKNKEGFIPGVLYGMGFNNKNLFINSIELEKILKKEGDATSVELDGDIKQKALIKDIQRNPVSYKPQHIDLYVLAKGQRVHTTIPLEYIGTSPAMKLGANIVKVLYELQLEVDADNIPKVIEVDLAKLSLTGQSIHISDLQLPKGSSLYHSNAEDVVATAVSQVEEDLSLPVEGVDMDNISVEEKGKKEEETE
ncbi:MAG: 50S ribosomal protein L25 [Candidatus Pacebacteria bacterium]|nr:50S ribosomal protein L25 [Candidatus Paceibacterota bacterium]